MRPRTDYAENAICRYRHRAETKNPGMLSCAVNGWSRGAVNGRCRGAEDGLSAYRRNKKNSSGVAILVAIGPVRLLSGEFVPPLSAYAVNGKK